MKTQSGNMAEVEIDYVNKLIHSNHIHKPKNKVMRYLEIFLCYMFSRIAVYSSFMFLVIIISINKQKISNDLIPASYFVILVLVTLFVSVIFMTLYHFINAKYADIFFAKFNSFAISKNKLIIDDLKEKNLLFYPEDFRNIFIRYNATEDYSEFLNNIKVVKLNKKKDGKFKQNSYWAIRFLFSKIPRKGMIELNYC